MRWLKALGSQFWNDVYEDPSVGPSAGVLLSLLAALLVWLTIAYAPGAADRAEEAASATRLAGDGVIDPVWGKITIALMAAGTLIAGFEPVLSRRFRRWRRRIGSRRWRSLSRPVRWTLLALRGFLLSPAKLASFVWSFVDYILARPVAAFAGAAWRGWGKRYTHFIGLMAIAIGASAAAENGLIPPGQALAAIAAALIVVAAVVRRWTWIESDRDAFLIERGERRSGKGRLRVGFEEDLRDEALFALSCLFVLIPVGLDLVQQTTNAAGAPAFAFESGAMPASQWARFVLWFGYFGVELAKAAPFVDWAEVFHVANGSPIEARTVLGAQIVFALRAGLDLVFLAAVLQAVRTVTRLRNQKHAFDASRLPILEPFSEREELAGGYDAIIGDLDLRPSAQPAIRNIPRYDAARLRELIDGAAVTRSVKVRKAASALLQKELEAAPAVIPDTLDFWTARTRTEPDADYRRWLYGVAAGFDPDEPERLKDMARRARLLTLVEEDWNDAEARAQAVRLLGRSGLTGAEEEALLRRLVTDKELSVQAAAAVALAKANTPGVFGAIETLIRTLPDSAIIPAQACAFAAAHQTAPADEIAGRFARPLRPHAHTAAQLQRAPMDIEAAKTAPKFTALCETVAIRPGRKPFPDSFLMGSANDDPEADEREKPQRRIRMRRPYALGRFPVTIAAYDAFAHATGRSSLEGADNQARPALGASWFDAQDFCRWLQAVTGEAWRLPSEAEWEYACRAGTGASYSWGPDWDPSKANGDESRFDRVRDVGSYEPNGWGLWDMHGGAAEWCLDPLHDDYRGDPPGDHTPWVEGGDFAHRVARGGSWADDARLLRSADRNWGVSTERWYVFGFRLARTL